MFDKNLYELRKYRQEICLVFNIIVALLALVGLVTMIAYFNALGASDYLIEILEDFRVNPIMLLIIALSLLSTTLIFFRKKNIQEQAIPKTFVDYSKNYYFQSLLESGQNIDSDYVIFQHIQQAERVERQQLAAEFTKALQNEELELYYQPQIELCSKRIIGAEALVRWHHPRKGFMSPDKFIYILTNNLLDIKLGEWVINSALKTLSKRDDELIISVNITPFHLQQDDFFGRLQRTLAHYPTVNPAYLKIELTETSYISDHKRLEATMYKCKDLGVTFSLDDFGTGYSALSQLRLLPASQLKIDRSFIQNLEDSEQDKKMVLSIIMLANNYDIEVVAEGIETKEQQEILEHAGCQVGQGYRYLKPVPYSKFNEWLEHHT
ncbi:EAL domain-containing protein [Vibrio sp. TH_r3]|uniref:putative bifunctional diguanylate cyclase/phosphodiesterase n=1 Tax=Vibrio sp. TH_r3 TaxID=3082084 RepID=UPI002954C54C|nr:EAL domain-containing protein [Vibrio sp. TH_r3]MDV7105105.1 EAL domain-containing protein [Vibrio sp. TH_r3]